MKAAKKIRASKSLLPQTLLPVNLMTAAPFVLRRDKYSVSFQWCKGVNKTSIFFAASAHSFDMNPYFCPGRLPFTIDRAPIQSAVDIVKYCARRFPVKSPNHIPVTMIFAPTAGIRTSSGCFTKSRPTIGLNFL